MDAKARSTMRSLSRTAKSCGPDASTLAFKLVEAIPPATVTIEPDHRGEHVISRNTIARGMPDESGVTVVTISCAFYFCTRGCGASSARHSLRPLNFRRLHIGKTRAELRGEIAEAWVGVNCPRCHCEEQRDEAIQLSCMRRRLANSRASLFLSLLPRSGGVETSKARS